MKHIENDTAIIKASGIFILFTLWIPLIAEAGAYFS